MKEGKRERTDVDNNTDVNNNNTDAPRAKRKSKQPYENVVGGRAQQVLEYWQALAPMTRDSQKRSDIIAERIQPSNSRNCAAIMQRQNGLPLVAMNSWNTPSVEGGENHIVVFAQGHYEKATTANSELHAEMKILQYCGENKIPIDGYIGISKPCCLRCAVVMRILGHGKKHRGCSGGLWDAGWVIPPFVLSNSNHLMNFMGQKAHDWYSDLTESQQSDFRMRLQSLK